ncbi:MAG: hypothetical protein FWG68_03725, partial [Defluviitaleaceae bacterium]|nr:hypothetical protein [Defluviitaleaceae bacterium]
MKPNKSQNLITENWQKSQLPATNAIIYPCGMLTILDFYKIFNPNTDETAYFCTPLCDTTIDSFLKYNDDCWVKVSEWTSIPYKNGQIKGGDGGMGNEGFIACVDECGDLLWAMFFDTTNPIKRLKINENTLIAVNEHDEL